MIASPHLWFYLAVGAAVSWGVGYALVEKVLKAGISPFVLLSLTGITHFIAFSLIFYFSSSSGKNQVELLKTPSVLVPVIICCLFYLLGNAFVFTSIGIKNASLSSLIEIAYPFFVVLFSWLFFREVHVNFYTIVGGLLIFSGVSLIFLKSS